MAEDEMAGWHHRLDGRDLGSAAVEIALSAATWLCATILHAGPAGGVGHSVRGCADGGDRQ